MAADAPERRMRTAILAVHGIGSQRAMETVRGIVAAAWSSADGDGQRRVWTHPEKSGVDIDLAVITTNEIPRTEDRRVADFHELYWAHLMSETKPIAVLLWLYELARKGPRLRPGMNGVWWFAAIFLALLNLSLALLALQAIAWFAGVAEAPQAMVIAPYLMVLVALLFGIAAALRYCALRLLAWLIAAAVAMLALGGGAFLLVVELGGQAPWNVSAIEAARLIANIFFPGSVAFLATFLLMGRFGALTFVIALAMSYVLFGFYLLYVATIAPHFGWPHDSTDAILRNGWVPWSLSSSWSAVAAFAIIGLYLVLNATFLQPYLGDAARYFRSSPGNVAVRREIRKQAVDTLEALHLSGRYDRIVVVAHSQGTVVAYDMLRAYYGRICRDIPVRGQSYGAVQAANSPATSTDEARRVGRDAIRELIEAAAREREDIAKLPADPKRRDPRAWLVTDFVTLGSPLTHAHYLMCVGRTRAELEDDFKRRVKEREFPTCPPEMLNGDGRLLFKEPSGRPRFHSGGVFALTRWTNLYFPLGELVWGDPIGGRVGDIFGGGVRDVKVWTRRDHKDVFFAHNDYWGSQWKPDAPQIRALRDAINLQDMNPPPPL